MDAPFSKHGFLDCGRKIPGEIPHKHRDIEHANPTQKGLQSNQDSNWDIKLTNQHEKMYNIPLNVV